MCAFNCEVPSRLSIAANQTFLGEPFKAVPRSVVRVVRRVVWIQRPESAKLGMCHSLLQVGFSLRDL